MPAPGGLTGLLGPVSATEFFSRYWTRQHLHGRGPAARFSALLSWTALNRILESHWREIYRFRLAKQGRDIDPSSYADLALSPPRVRSRDVLEHLRRGATLSFHAIDECHEPLARLAEAIEASLGAGTQINVYAGFRASHGLDLHRDDEEVFILHLEGRKRWLLYGVDVAAFDRRELSASSVPPDGASFDEILQAGDLLYIPRGCYHLAVPMNEPTLHLTVGVKGPGLKPRPVFGLPWSAIAERLPPGADFSIRLKGEISKTGEEADAAPIERQSRGRTYRFPAAMRWILEQLEQETPIAFGQLVESSRGRLDGETVRLLVTMLARFDLVEIAALDSI